MSRAVPAWKGKTDDTPVPPRVRIRVLEAKGRRCHMCGRVINPLRESWTCEHLVAIINGGANAEHNLDVTCSLCLPVKNGADVAEKSRIATKRKKHALTKQPSRSFRKPVPPPGHRYNAWSRRMEKIA